MSLDFWENVLHILKAYYPNQVTECAIKASPTVDVYTNIVPSRQTPSPLLSLPLPQPQQQPQQQQQIPPVFHPGMYTNPMMFNQPNYMSVMTAAQYIMNTAAAYNSMLTQPQPYMIHSPVLSPQPHHVQIKRKPVQYHPSYAMSPQLEQRIHRKKLPPQQKKKVRFEEVPTLYTYEAQESEEEEKDIQDGFYDESQHYTRPSSSSSSSSSGGGGGSGRYTSNRPWSSNRMMNDRFYHYDDDDDDDDEVEDYGDLWEKRYYIRRHDSLDHRPPPPPIRRSRV
ncbi:unnamed protein product [Rhizopus stolonifer]